MFYTFDNYSSFKLGQNGVDYLYLDTAITIPSGTVGESLICFNVTIEDDERIENNEQFFLILHSLSPDLVAVIEDFGRQTIIILDNECEYFIQMMYKWC